MCMYVCVLPHEDVHRSAGARLCDEGIDRFSCVERQGLLLTGTLHILSTLSKINSPPPWHLIAPLPLVTISSALVVQDPIVIVRERKTCGDVATVTACKNSQKNKSK